MSEKGKAPIEIAMMTDLGDEEVKEILGQK
jgi:hypothetical protein